MTASELLQQTVKRALLEFVRDADLDLTSGALMESHLLDFYELAEQLENNEYFGV